MKNLIFLLMMGISGFSFSQEFTTYPNGLIYDEGTMNRLGVIVDSLNLKFRSCDLSKPYYSFAQGMATLVQVPNKTAKKLLQSNVSLEDYLKQYPGKTVKKLWVVKSHYTDYRNNRYVEYSGLPYGWNDETSIRLRDTPKNNKSSGWIVDEDELIAFHLDQLQLFTLPYEYARLVQYVDCMIDTTASIYFPTAEGEVYQVVDDDSKAGIFVAWAQKFANEPKMPDSDNMDRFEFEKQWNAYLQQRRTWDSLRFLSLGEKMAGSAYWRRTLEEAADEAIADGNSSNEFEIYVERYLSKEKALELKRSRKVIGGCSMDLSPRYHAMEICQLAAETTQWDIFLRSHLDIMNDRFDRMSDGSYAWEGRKTYLKELEELDIPAIDLLLGTSLRVSNTSENHYWGYIGRTGRALSDAADKPALEQQLATMIQDEKLDPYNRLLMAYVFSNYAANLEDESLVRASKQRLASSVASWPVYLQDVWNKE
jgi:hypothetical protein